VVAERGSDGGGLIAPGIDTTRPSIARVYDLFLDGKDNYESDRALYRQIVEIAPETPVWAQENRRWLGRVVAYLAGEAKISQFLDAGSGLPTAENTHQLAQRLDPEVKVVYVDNDPSVIAHGQALLVDNESTQFAAADLTDVRQVLTEPAVTKLIDFDRPVAVLLALVLHHIEDIHETRGIVAEYADALPSGSYLAISHAVNPRDGSEADGLATAIEARFKPFFPTLTPRTPAEIATLFDGLDLVDPGLVRLFDWHHHTDDDLTPTPDLRPAAAHLLYGALARKP
jgi:hypothetical protein